MWNSHRHRESKNTKLYENGSGTKLFITFELKVIQHERERHTIFLCWLLLHRQLPTQLTVPAQLWKSSFFFRGGNSTNSFFSNLSPHFQCMTSLKYPGHNSNLGFLFWHFWMTHPLCVRVKTCVNVVPN